jgi:hypothetical protein
MAAFGHSKQMQIKNYFGEPEPKILWRDLPTVIVEHKIKNKWNSANLMNFISTGGKEQIL